jgi:S-adenosylmethionine-diacylglycerol 3-amino-3-carboxypropyl transferase
MDPGLRKDALLEIFSSLKYQNDILGPIDFVAEIGPDYSGRYELLFKRLQYEIEANNDSELLLNLNDVVKQQAFLAEHSDYKARLKAAFSNVMSLPNLVRIFGTEATQNSVMPFAKHFYLRTIQAIETMKAVTNPYLSQLLRGKFTTNNIYPWLNLEKKMLDTEINYKLCSMADSLVNSSDCYDFIHLSNILDWLTEKQASELLRLVYNKLNKGGLVIIRQLNSNLSIPKLGESLTWDLDQARLLHTQDRSFFYQKLHIARK